MSGSIREQNRPFENCEKHIQNLKTLQASERGLLSWTFVVDFCRGFVSWIFVVIFCRGFFVVDFCRGFLAWMFVVDCLSQLITLSF